MLLTRILDRGSTEDIIGVIARGFLYRGVQQTQRWASCRTPVCGRTPRSFLVSSRNEWVRADLSTAVLQTTRLADQEAEFLGNEYPIMKIYVSNLPAGASDAGLAKLFEPFGVITSAHVMTSGVSGRCRGFGFVEMMRESGERAISKLNGQIRDGMVLRVNEAKARL